MEVRPGSRKGAALLAYLCVRAAAVRRDVLAELLWGPGRLANLRQELYALRKLPGAVTWLSEHGDTVAVSADTDVAALERVLAGADVPSAALDAVKLLPGLELIATPAFRDWLEQARNELELLAERALRAGAERLEAEGRHDDALELVDAALGADPLDEVLHRAAIRLAFQVTGQYGAQLRFDACREDLQRELGVAPSAETLALMESIRDGKPLPADPAKANLPADLEELALALAIGEGALDVETVSEVLERRPLAVAGDLARLERAGWLDEQLQLAPQLATKVISRAPAAVRQLLHGRVAQALLSVDRVPAETVATHLLRAGKPAAAAPLLLRAAENRIQRSAPAEAVPLLLRACWAAYESPSVLLEASLLLEGCAAQLGDEALQDAALAVAEDLGWQLQRDVDLAEVKMRRSRSLLRSGRVGEGLERALEALEIAARIRDERLIARARNAIGGAQFYAGDLDGAERSFTANVTAPDPVERYRARNNLGSIAGIRGRPADALVHLEEALTLARASGQQGDIIGTLNNLAATADRSGDYRRAVRYFRESLALARRSGSVGLEGQVLVNLAVVYSRLGELGPAWNTACEVEEVAERHRDARLGMRAGEQKAEVAYLCGLDELANTEYRAAAAASAALGDERKSAELDAQRAVVATRTSQERVAAAVAAIERLEASGWKDVVPWLWLELALATAEPLAAAGWTARVRSQPLASPHLSFVTALAELRTGLLDGAGPLHLERADAAQRVLFGAEAGAGLIDTLSCVQVPQAWLLGSLWREAGGSSAGGFTVEPAVHERVAQALGEQAAGLPRAMATSLVARPASWLASLRSVVWRP